ncbi:MAG: glycosyltransferase family 9 protein [Cryomorphaceae bacterium]|nr:glycosyltransferase family 9 protein [Cryomorphaceae bacterium]
MTILVIRLSAIGDVAMLYPELYRFVHAHPEVRVKLLTRKFLMPIFDDLPQVECLEADVNGKHKGIGGLVRLAKEIRPLDIDVVLDMHDVLRSQVLRRVFRRWGTQVFSIDKGRKEKKKMVKKRNKHRTSLPHSAERYRKVFNQAGFSYPINDVPPISPRPKILNGIGVAPFAGFPQKQWPFEKIITLVKKLSESGEKVIMFGAPGAERKRLEHLCNYPGVSVAEPSGGLKAELQIMAGLRCMLSMDSGNGHLATLVGCPVVTVWGATHKDAGFSPLGEVQHIEIPTEELPCRPCSVFGSKPCWRGDLACLERIEVNSVFKALTSY